MSVEEKNSLVELAESYRMDPVADADVAEQVDPRTEEGDSGGARLRRGTRAAVMGSLGAGVPGGTGPSGAM